MFVRTNNLLGYLSHVILNRTKEWVFDVHEGNYLLGYLSHVILNRTKEWVFDRRNCLLGYWSHVILSNSTGSSFF